MRCRLPFEARFLGLLAGAVLLAGCGSGDQAPEAPGRGDPERAAPASSAPRPASEERPGTALRWRLLSSGEGAALALLPDSGRAAIRLFCPAGQDRLLVNVPGFRPVGSEERLSFGGGGRAVALVADARGDRRRGGVSGTGALPDDLAAVIAGPVAASYGAQSSGPHPPPPADLASAFAAACREGAVVARPVPAPPSSPCRMQDGKPLGVPPLRALGTEPFWSARIEGRCVTYSHPEDPEGIRVWTRYTPASGGGTWSGALGGRRFELSARPRPGCSDGMSDKSYPVAVELLVGGERRSGCAEPL